MREIVGRQAGGGVILNANLSPREHMQKAFIQRRGQIVDDCVRLATDVEAYNAMNPDQPQIPMLFDFRDDVEELRFWDGGKAA